MAERLGISQNYLSLLENNRAEPSLGLIRRISDEFDVPASFLLWEENAQSEGADSEVAERLQRLRDLIHELQQLRISRNTHGRSTLQGR
jgi:transcriptional regulator with XRE-family HTH domain